MKNFQLNQGFMIEFTTASIPFLTTYVDYYWNGKISKWFNKTL